MKFYVSEWAVPLHALCGVGYYKVMAEGMEGNFRSDPEVVCIVPGLSYRDPAALHQAKAIAEALQYAKDKTVDFVPLAIKELY